MCNIFARNKLAICARSVIRTWWHTHGLLDDKDTRCDVIDVAAALCMVCTQKNVANSLVGKFKFLLNNNASHMWIVKGLSS